MSFNKRMLLTGAGFTANFGTPLARDVHNLICNHERVRSDATLRAYAESEPDFEQLYANVMNGSYTLTQRNAMQTAVSYAYSYIDNILRGLHFPTQGGLDILLVQELIGCFRGCPGSTGVYFTLNQDIYLERHQYNRGRPSLPGLRVPLEWFQAYSADATHDAFQISLPGANEVAALPPIGNMGAEIAYVKLHGSSNWKSVIRPQQMVIGSDKTGQIRAEPMLDWYFRQFRDALHDGQVKLLCIGYGFHDEHINNVIADAIENANLKLYVMNPQQRSIFTSILGGVPRGAVLIRGLHEYFPHDLLRICSSNNGYRTTEWEYICDLYFDGKFKEIMGG